MRNRMRPTLPSGTALPMISAHQCGDTSGASGHFWRAAVAIMSLCLVAILPPPAGADSAHPLLDRLRQRLQGTAVTQTALAAGTEVHVVAVGGQVRRYLLHVPPSLPAGPAPLVLAFHGLNSNAAQQEALSGLSAAADAAGFVVAYPEGLGRPERWYIGPREDGAADIAFARALVADVSGIHAIDPRRVYATGISNGAQMSYRLACVAPDLVAAIAPVAGGYFAYGDCKTARPVPVVAFHGTADRLLPYGGHPPLMLPVHDWAMSWAARNGCASGPVVVYAKAEVKAEQWSTCRYGADVVLYIIDGKGHSWPGSTLMPALITSRTISATGIMWDFFAAHPMP